MRTVHILSKMVASEYGSSASLQNRRSKSVDPDKKEKEEDGDFSSTISE